MTTIDSRAPRFGQSIVAVALLVGFVFSAPVVIPITAILVGIGAAAGPEHDPLVRIATTVAQRGLGSRRSNSRQPVRAIDSQSMRISAISESATLAVATLLVIAGLSSVAWFLALLVAAVAATMAITNVCLGCEVYERLRSRR